MANVSLDKGELRWTITAIEQRKQRLYELADECMRLRQFETAELYKGAAARHVRLAKKYNDALCVMLAEDLATVE